MSIQRRVTRKIKDVFGAALNFVEENLIETGGIAFSDGQCIELVKDDVGSLTFLGSKKKEFQNRIKIAGKEYVPPELSPSVLEALVLPSKRADCSSTVNTFSEICNFFIAHGVSGDAAKACTYFAFASWFPEFLPMAPCLILTGPESEAHILLQLLTCVARHALPLAEFNAVLFDLLPMHIQPTLLIGYVHTSMRRVFSASNHPHAYLANKNGLRDLYCAKAAYVGPDLDGVGGDAILSIHCALSCENLPVFNGASLEKMAANFQSRLLDYRIKHVAQVRDAHFDATKLPISIRMLAGALGSCIVDAPELQADIVRLLESQAEVLRANRLLDPNYVAIEAIFAHCHSENGSTRVGVGEIATTATAIMADRDENTLFESKTIGNQLRLLGFRPKRDSKGFAVHLSPDVRRHIHRLARDHRVGDSGQAAPGCPECAEVMSAPPERSNS